MSSSSDRRRVAFLIVLASLFVAVVFLCIGVVIGAEYGDTNEPTPEEIQALKDEWERRQELERRIHDIVPSASAPYNDESLAGTFNIITIGGLSEKGAILALYSFETKKKCHGAVLFEVNRLVTYGCEPEAL